MEEIDPTGEWANEERTEEVARGTEDGDNMRRELELIRRENALLERELQLARREIDHAYRKSHSSSPQGRRNDETRLKLGEMKELIAYFDGNSRTYENWERQVRFIKKSYNLSDDFTKVLVSTKLKGKIEWFHSRSDFLEISSEALVSHEGNIRPSACQNNFKETIRGEKMETGRIFFGVLPRKSNLGQSSTSGRRRIRRLCD